MLIYSVTTKIEATIKADWLDWMQNHHIPEVLATGCFLEYRLAQLLDDTPESEGITYNIQYLCPEMEMLQRYQQNYAPALQAAYRERYEGRYTIFRTLLNVLSISNTSQYSLN